ncbi:hypothetical protein COY26_05455 [Candidatus Woesearchaeota archaeon CG_4_10_14_0_2_um_filter_33_10]|nr:MAG: hypothetical protein COV14_02675 [Candidatus Woesearchaeota archaeon CG10_big_fil_rev_8_21_14_0_10_33_12]PIU72179.1 MAG: hypothetical protein COS79_04365 [Candidatus Woesearchaeota archaeon CG06_land_8_20_14_3_00_33_13]PIZ51848.1 MAG: hypothetical protein COY26_05455 [Candidatus Woesearchaeota archaeon CG_4_10_14_0_2_um_filter_33_10]
MSLMLKSKKIKKDFLIALLIAFIIILSSFNYYLYSTSFHSSLIRKYSGNPSHLEIDRNVTRYITGFSSELNVNFNEKEKSHMADVRRLIILEQLLFVFLMVWLFVLIKKRKINYSHLKKSALIVFLITLLSLIASLFFDSFFELFHIILFPQGNWQFNAGSLMIQTYRQSFFREFFIRFIMVAFIFSLLLVLLIKIIEKKLIINSK